MPPTHPADFEHAIHSANIWLKAVSEALGHGGPPLRPPHPPHLAAHVP